MRFSKRIAAVLFLASFVLLGTLAVTWLDFPLLPGKERWRAPSYPPTSVDLESELRRLGLEELDLVGYQSSDNPATIAYYMTGLRALTPQSLTISKAIAIESLLELSSFLNPANVLKLSAEIFAVEYPPERVGRYTKSFFGA